MALAFSWRWWMSRTAERLFRRNRLQRESCEAERLRKSAEISQFRAGFFITETKRNIRKGKSGRACF